MPTAQPARRRGRPKGSKNKRVRATARVPATEALALRPAEAAKLVRCSLSKMKLLIRQGEVKSARVGRMRMVFVDSLKELLGLTSDGAQP